MTALPDHYLARESVIALDPTSGAVAWQRQLGRIVFTDFNNVPSFGACPTPAAFSTGSTPLRTLDAGVPFTVDAVGAEPTPNGARINLGAFGRTSDAELSAPAGVEGAPSPTPTPSTPKPAGPTENSSHEIGGAAGGCALGGGAPGADSAASLMLVLAALVRDRRRRTRS